MSDDGAPADLSAFGGGVATDADPSNDEDAIDPRARNTSDDYRYTRPQCIARTADGDRCSNPVLRGEGVPFCPRHNDADVETIGGDQDGGDGQ